MIFCVCRPGAWSPLRFVKTSAFAADYPTKPVHWLVGYVPGGTTDILARLIGQYLSEKTGQQFIIENKAGAGNNLAVEAVLAAPADGYTVLLVNPANGINATLYKKLSFNFVRDIAPVGGLMRVPNVMVVNNDVPAKTVKEFIDYVKANPGKVNMASSGNGTSVHLSGELFMAMTGAKMTHVPYRGSNPALTDIMGGQCQVLFDNMPSSIELIKGGKIRALAVTTEKRASYFPDLPTVAETVTGYEASAWFGMGVQGRDAARHHRHPQQARSKRRWPIRRSRRGSPISAARRWAARRKTSARSSCPRPRSGRRWSSSPARASSSQRESSLRSGRACARPLLNSVYSALMPISAISLP